MKDNHFQELGLGHWQRPKIITINLGTQTLGHEIEVNHDARLPLVENQTNEGVYRVRKDRHRLWRETLPLYTIATLQYLQGTQAKRTKCMHEGGGV